MKKILLVIIIISTNINANPLEVANNVFNEYNQVIELIKQLNEMKKQIENQAKQIKNISGQNIITQSALESYVQNYYPNVAEQLLKPSAGGASDSYSNAYNSIMDEMQLYDIDEYYENKPLNEPKIKEEKKRRQWTFAASAYGETQLSQTPKRVQVVNDYLTKVGGSDNIKKSVDIQNHIIAQSVKNQIEINRSMAILLGLESAKAKKALLAKKYLRDITKFEE